MKVDTKVDTSEKKWTPGPGGCLDGKSGQAPQALKRKRSLSHFFCPVNRRHVRKFLKESGVQF